MANFGGFRAGLEIGFPDLIFFVEDPEVFSELSSEVIDVLLGPVEHKSSVDVTVSSGWSAIYVSLDKCFSIKKGPAFFTRKSF